MARADLLVDLVQSATEGDERRFRKTLESVVAEERKKQHNVLAEKLEEFLTPNGTGQDSEAFQSENTIADERVRNLLLRIRPRRTLDDLVLPKVVSRACNEVAEEYHRRELLRSHGLEPRHRLLLVGPPGNGKTSLAEALAEALMVPMFSVRYEGVIGSYLGETAERLRRIFDFVATRECVLFFDEFDTLGKERGDEHETGEIKRVVSSLLLQIDDLPSHVVVITATNHPELLDRAVWRRFQLRLELPKPNQRIIAEWLGRLERSMPEGFDLPASDLAATLEGASFAEIEDFVEDIHRRLVLGEPNEANLQEVVGQRLKQWQNRFTTDQA